MCAVASAPEGRCPSLADWVTRMGAPRTGQSRGRANVVYTRINHMKTLLMQLDVQIAGEGQTDAIFALAVAAANAWNDHRPAPMAI